MKLLLFRTGEDFLAARFRAFRLFFRTRHILFHRCGDPSTALMEALSLCLDEKQPGIKFAKDKHRDEFNLIVLNAVEIKLDLQSFNLAIESLGKKITDIDVLLRVQTLLLQYHFLTFLVNSSKSLINDELKIAIKALLPDRNLMKKFFDGNDFLTIQDSIKTCWEKITPAAADTAPILSEEIANQRLLLTAIMHLCEESYGAEEKAELKLS